MSVYNLSQYLSLSLFYYFLFDVCFYFCKRLRLTYVLNSDLTCLDSTRSRVGGTWLLWNSGLVCHTIRSDATAMLILQFEQEAHHTSVDGLAINVNG